MDTEVAERPPAPAVRRSADKKQLTVWMDADMHKRMSRLKVEEGIDLREQIEQAVADYLKKHGY